WKLGKLVLSWIAIFCVGMLVLKTFGSGANSRQGKVLAMFWQILEQPELFAALSDMLRGTLFLLLPGLGLLLCRSSRVALLGLLLTALPVLAVTTLASFAYLPSVEAFLVHGTSWPYRFGMLWGLVGAALIFSPRTALGKSPFLCFVMVLLSFVGQYYMLNSVRNYNVIQRTLTARQPSNQLSIKEKVVLNCLKAILPSKTAVMTSGPFTAYFSHLDWSYGGNNAHAKMQAEVIVCDKGKFGFNFLCREELAARPESDWVKKEVHGLQIGFRKDNKKINRFVRACL
ncbi:MAG: hypothetical protein KDD62_04995, partial [Bdellovibrionales bacterium]|nr:hypothetical protein [Bdellovibrionales bacterium]